MLIEGKVLRLGGKVDHQGDRFSRDCQLTFPEGQWGLPVWFAIDPWLQAGRVEAMWLEGDTWMARVLVSPEHRTPVSVARAVTANLGLCVKGNVSKEHREGDANVIDSLRVSGLMLGINVDLDLPEPGFTILDPKQRFRLLRGER